MKIMKSGGFGLLESVVGAAILTVIFVGGLTAFGNSLRLGREAVRLTKASFLLQEGAEVLRLWRDAGWNNIAGLNADTVYYFNFNGSSWATTTSASLIDGVFEREFRAADVYRDEADDIVPSGTLDPDTRQFEVSVSWRSGNATTTRALKLYLTNLFDT
jgi:type II secretory pathway pseudopilin PulG